MKHILTLLILSVAYSALAFLPPIDTRAGVRVEIESFPQKTERNGKNPYDWPLGVTEVTAKAPRSFPVILENITDNTISGKLEVWMNDDWSVSGPQGQLSLAPNETKKLIFTGTANSQALNALYPVHARFTPTYTPISEAPHAIAIFMLKGAKTYQQTVATTKRTQTPQTTEEEWIKREQIALSAAKAALISGSNGTNGWKLATSDINYGAGIAYGEHGIIDGALAFTDGTRSIVFRGFTATVETNENTPHLEAHAIIKEKNGTLQISWSLPDIKRNKAGYPRIVDLAIGAASEKPYRVYFGFGNVIENPKKFNIIANGFELSTRHVGADYENGLSIVQAVDVVPDGLVCDGKNGLFSIHAHHDATFTFIPSSKGAFDAARRFRAVAGYKRSPGLDALGSRMCLDQWEGDYEENAKNLALAAKYGLNDSIFVKHVWQRWGYDYRLPEIFPPAGNQSKFKAMRQACKDAGILFCLHDNYTDIYPDCEGFSYNLAVFNLDSTPQLAWFNPYRYAQSYRWAPHAFHPWCLRNAKLLKKEFDPEAIFIDVLTAHCPFDYLDRDGQFHSKNETSKNWGRAFDVYREGFERTNAVCISEAGQDHLIGTVDGAQSDHFQAEKILGNKSNFADSERTPWHDIVSHGYFVLFAGGLGGRYQEEKWHEGGNADLHGYGSDDYLSNTIIGGRNPMSDGPFSRNAVKTYWLQHDICAKLGQAEFLDLKYEGNIHRQHSFFSNNGEVWVNRDTKSVWKLDNGITLPPYGYYARIGETESYIAEKNGIRYAMANSPNRIFVDARTPAADPLSTPITKPLNAELITENRIKISLSWETRAPLKEHLTFVHICDQDAPFDGIVFHGSISKETKILRKVGKHETAINILIPEETPAGTYAIRYGVWNPITGQRHIVGGAPTDSTMRAKGGTLKIERDSSKISNIIWQPETSKSEIIKDKLLGSNYDSEIMDFGKIKTNGSFKFENWVITPLPNSRPFFAEIDLATFGASGKCVKRVEAIDAEADAKQPEWIQKGDKLMLNCDAKAFAYRIHISPQVWGSN